MKNDRLIIAKYEELVAKVKLFWNISAIRSIAKLESELSVLESEQTEEGETFRKVWIKSESDLPKETGQYFTGEKFDSSFGIYNYDPKEEWADIPKSLTGKGYWLKYIGWYLLPVSSLQSSEPAERISLMEKYGITESDVNAAVKIYCMGKDLNPSLQSSEPEKHRTAEDKLSWRKHKSGKYK